jgi:hypothetical protein
MNERIKELAEQAGYEKDMFGVGHWDMPECKKFAELIIQECMRMCDCADVSLLEHGCDKEASGAASAKEFIKEWFGVEE